MGRITTLHCRITMCQVIIRVVSPVRQALAEQIWFQFWNFFFFVATNICETIVRKKCSQTTGKPVSI